MIGYNEVLYLNIMSEDYKKIANDARKKVLQMAHLGQTSHIGSNFSCMDIMAVLFSKLNLDKDLEKDRDRFVLSKGWVAASLYYFLAEKGIIPKEDLEEFGKEGSKYIGLAEIMEKEVPCDCCNGTGIDDKATK